MPKHREGHAHVTLHGMGDRAGGAHADHERAPSARRGFRFTLLGVGLGVVVAAVLLTLLGDGGASRKASERRDVGALASDAPTTADQEQEVTDCRAAWNDVNQVFAAMQPTMEQWEFHIEAMNQLVAGEITLAQASRFWEQTRVGAARRYRDFAEADEQLTSASQHVCTGPATTCAQAIQAAHDTLGAARTTLATWHHHIIDMNRLRAGTLSPTAAQQMWLKVWRQGEEDLRRYHELRRRSQELTCGE